jgi:hypothetical protein
VSPEERDDFLVSFTVDVENVSQRDARRIMGLLKTMQRLGSIGASREVAMFCDGDGCFRPKFDFSNKIYTKGKYKGQGALFGPRGSMFISGGDDPFFQ